MMECNCKSKRWRQVMAGQLQQLRTGEAVADVDGPGGNIRHQSRAGLKIIPGFQERGNLGLLANMAKRAGLPWDLILSAEVFGAFKPDPKAYLGVADVFDLRPEETMLVATHKADLRGALRCGLATAYVERPREEGPSVQREESRDPAFTLHATDFNDLADQLGCP